MEHYPKQYLYRRIVQSKLFIDKYYHENIELEKIADAAFFSKYHFIRLFKTVYNKTPHQYLTTVRIEKAKEHLKAGISISETCTLVGFDSASTFTGLFKKTAGVTPSEYQQRQALQMAAITNAPLAFIPGCLAAANGWKKSNFQEVL